MDKDGVNLTAVAQFIRSPKFWLVLGSFFAVLIILGFLFPFAPKNPANVWRGIALGETKRAEAIKVLGNPIRQKNDRGYLIDSYKGDSKFSEHAVFYRNETAVLVKERIDQPKEGGLTSLTGIYGSAYLRLFGPGSSSGFSYYAYFAKGVLIVANSFDGTVFELWYFVPSTQAEFLAGPGFELSLSPPRE